MFSEYIKNRDLDLFRKWKISIDIDDDRKLTHEGEEEMLLLAERMQSRFPEIFDSAYSNTSYRVRKKATSTICFPSVKCSFLYFSLNTLVLKEHKKAPTISLPVYLAKQLREMYGIQQL